jgi:hypothetical protein
MADEEDERPTSFIINEMVIRVELADGADKPEITWEFTAGPDPQIWEVLGWLDYVAECQRIVLREDNMPGTE